MKKVPNSAYPKVISNLGTLNDTEDTQVAIKMIRYMNHFARSVKERKAIIDFFKEGTHRPPVYKDVNGRQQELGPSFELFRHGPGDQISTNRFLAMLSDFFPVGFSTTLGYAHPNTGDTMTSVMIGGLRTVMNGDFEIFPGDLVQFYWSFERDDFLQDGRRKPYVDMWQDSLPTNLDPSKTIGGDSLGKRDAWDVPRDARLRQAHYELSYGQKPDKQKLVGKIKPYVPDEEDPRINDWYRVFAVAISSARPNEMCDIKISRQSV